MSVPSDKPELHPFFARLLERLPVAAYVCSPDGSIRWYNRAAVELWGLEPDGDAPEQRYCGSLRLFHADGTPMAHSDCWMARALREERPFEGCEVQIERPDGERAWALAYATPVRDEAGALQGAVNVLVDVTGRRRAEQSERRHRDDLQDFFENAAVGLHWVGGDGTVLWANRAELELLGYDRDEYVGRHIADFHADAEVIEDILQRLAAGDTLRRYEARLLHKDGSIRHVQISSNARLENGNLVRTRCFTVDVTDQRRAEQELRAHDRFKDEFLAMLAHELRNPLAPMQSALELLRLEGPPDPRLIEAHGVIARQVTQMSRLVDDLLDVARITGGKLQVRRERIELARAVQNAIEATQPSIDERGHRVELSLPEAPVWLDADPVRITQALGNLIGNAARFTEPGGCIEIRAGLVTREERPWVQLAVRDDGRGIEQAQLERIFGMFEQAEGPEQVGRGSSGLGIGLTLVQQVVELHGGTITAYSEGPGRGSEFRIELPVAEAPAAAATPAEPAPQLGPLRVLVVDDNTDSALSLEMLLETLGHRAQKALSGADALARAEEFQPDVVLLDIGLPDLDGYEICRRLRQQPWAGDALFVAVTGWGQEEHRRRSREAGFDRHVTKPLRLPVLRDLLRRVAAR